MEMKYKTHNLISLGGCWAPLVLSEAHVCRVIIQGIGFLETLPIKSNQTNQNKLNQTPPNKPEALWSCILLLFPSILVTRRRLPSCKRLQKQGARRNSRAKPHARGPCCIFSLRLCRSCRDVRAKGSDWSSSAVSIMMGRECE